MIHRAVSPGCYNWRRTTRMMSLSRFLRLMDSLLNLRREQKHLLAIGLSAPLAGLALEAVVVTHPPVWVYLIPLAILVADAVWLCAIYNQMTTAIEEKIHQAAEQEWVTADDLLPSAVSLPSEHMQACQDFADTLLGYIQRQATTDLQRIERELTNGR